MPKTLRFASTALCALVMLWEVSVARAECKSGSNCQIILSVTGLTASCVTTAPLKDKHAGFWLWSQPPSADNTYGGGGQGSMYFYGFAFSTVPVEVSNVSLSGNSVSENASGTSNAGETISCVSGCGAGGAFGIAAHETSPGKGVLDCLSCTVSTSSNSGTCTASNVAIDVNISNSK
jgi:hypothetical protein